MNVAAAALAAPTGRPWRTRRAAWLTSSLIMDAHAASILRPWAHATSFRAAHAASLRPRTDATSLRSHIARMGALIAMAHAGPILWTRTDATPLSSLIHVLPRPAAPDPVAFAAAPMALLARGPSMPAGTATPAVPSTPTIAAPVESGSAPTVRIEAIVATAPDKLRLMEQCRVSRRAQARALHRSGFGASAHSGRGGGHDERRRCRR